MLRKTDSLETIYKNSQVMRNKCIETIYKISQMMRNKCIETTARNYGKSPRGESTICFKAVFMV